MMFGKIPETARAKKKCETRIRLMESAYRLFSKREFEEVKVSEITREAGLAKGTFFNYFHSKEDVVSEVQFMTTYDKLMPILQLTGAVVPQIKQVLVAMLTDDTLSKPLMRAVLLTKLKDTRQLQKNADQVKMFYEGMVTLVDKAKQLGEIRDDLESFYVVKLVEQLHMGLLMQWCFVLEESTLNTDVAQSFDILFDGLKPRSYEPSLDASLL